MQLFDFKGQMEVVIESIKKTALELIIEEELEEAKRRQDREKPLVDAIKKSLPDIMKQIE